MVKVKLVGRRRKTATAKKHSAVSKRHTAGSKKKSHPRSHRGALGKLKKSDFEALMIEKMVHPHIIHHLKASGFFDNLLEGLKTVGTHVIKNLPHIIKTGKQIYDGYKESGVKGAISKGFQTLTGGKRKRKTGTKKTTSRKKTVHAKKMKTRGLKIAKIMKEHKVSLGEASHMLSSGY